MRKQLIIVLFVALLSITYGFETSPTAASLGDKAPEFTVTDNQHSFTLQHDQSRYTLVAFWSSQDAESRTLAAKYSRWYDNTNKDNIRYAAINLDNDNALYNEILRQDNLPLETQYFGGSDILKTLQNTYGISDRLGAILIDPTGTIVEVNPSQASLESIIRS